MAQIVLFSKQECPYCDRAKILLDSKKVSYLVRDVAEPATRAEIAELVQSTLGDVKLTFPQLVVDGRLVPGGFANMAAMDERGDLEPLLGMGLVVSDW